METSTYPPPPNRKEKVVLNVIFCQLIAGSNWKKFSSKNVYYFYNKELIIVIKVGDVYEISCDDIVDLIYDNKSHITSMKIVDRTKLLS